MSSHPQPGEGPVRLTAETGALETRKGRGGGSGCASRERAGGRTEEPASEASPREGWCPQCQSPRCLALVRAEEPPTDLKDLVYRLVMLISSGHWSWRKTANLVAIAGCLVFLIYVCIGNKVPITADHLSRSPWALGLLAGGCVPASSYGVWRVFRRKSRPADANPAIPDAGPGPGE
jgi:hypothetical protein